MARQLPFGFTSPLNDKSEKPDADSSKLNGNLQIYTYLVYVIALGVISITQLIVTCKFFYQTRKIQEVGILSKVLIILGNISVLANLLLEAYYAGLRRQIIETILPLEIFLHMALNFPIAFILANWMRLIRVQVQLRTATENTKSIISKIKRTTWIQYLWIISLVMSLVLYMIQQLILGIKVPTFITVSSIKLLSNAIVLNMFMFYSWKMNTQLKKFFLEIEDTSFPLKISRFVHIFGYLVGVNYAIQQLYQMIVYDPDHFEDLRRVYSDDYYVFTEISINFATSLIILYQTGAIYYLADVRFVAEPFENED